MGAWLIGVMIVMAGCVNQRAEVDSYRSIVDLPPGDRTQADGPMSLTEALRRAINANERLSIEGETYLQSLIDRQRTAASLLPTLDAFGNFTFRDKGSGGSDNPDTGSSSSARGTLFDGGLSGQYTLLTGLSDFRNVQASRLTIEQRHWLLLDLRETLALETARAYYDVLLGSRLIEVLQSSLVVQGERLRDIRGRQAVGFARPLDVVQIEAQASETRVSLIDAQNSVATARSALTLLTGIDASALALSDGYAPTSPAPTFDELMRMAEAGRQDLAAAAAAAMASRSLVDAQIGRYYPTISVNLDYFLTRDTTPTDRDFNGLLSIHLPIFSAGRIDADVRAAWSEFRKAVLRHSLTMREMRRDVEVAHTNLLATDARIQELHNQLAAAQEALRQAEAAYGAGLGTNLERVTAQDALLAAQVRLVREEFTGKVNSLAAMRATGMLTAVATGAAPDPATLPPRRPAPDSPFITLPGAVPATPPVPAPARTGASGSSSPPAGGRPTASITPL